MGFFNVIVAMCVGLIMLGGAVLTYHHRMAERQMEIESNPGAAVVAPASAKSTGLASLPKWDNKNYKGLVYRP